VIELDPDLERELDEIIIGERQPGPVALVEYDRAWPGRFEAVRAELEEALGPLAETIEHIGSTAVPGLAAKPIIDVLVTVSRIEPDAQYVSAIESLGYGLRVREAGHRMFRPPARDVHVHVWAEGSTDAQDYLLFRDRLRSSPADRRAYEGLKRELAPQDWPDLNYYARAKGPFVAELLERARAELSRGG
jgi:GrpB-like predicted nucleotidyltransferase (UPF0157 family)